MLLGHIANILASLSQRAWVFMKICGIMDMVGLAFCKGTGI